MKEREHKNFISLLLKVAAIVAVASIVVLFFFKTNLFTKTLGWIMNILMPFIYGFAIAYLLNPIASFIERQLGKLPARNGSENKKHRFRMTSIILALLFMFLVLILLVVAVLPSLIQSISSLISQIPDFVKQLKEWLVSMDKWEITHELVTYLEEVIDTFTTEFQDFLQKEILPNLEKYVSGVTTSFMGIFNFIKNFGLGCIVAVYLLASKEKFIAQTRLLFYALVPEKPAIWIENEVRFTDKMFSGFITGKLLDSLIIGCLCYIFMVIADMPYAVLISVVIGVTNIIPFFGPYIGAIPSALLILTVSPMKCLIFIIFIIILQNFDGNILGPAILGDRLGISGIWILFSILLFSSLWGFIGMIIGVPVFAVIYDMIKKAVNYLLHKKGRGNMITEYDAAFPKSPPKEKKKRLRKKKASKEKA